MAMIMDVPLWTVVPFVGMLLSIALFPLFEPHLWESNRTKVLVSAAWSAPVLLYFLLAHGADGATSSSTRARTTPRSSCCSARCS
jgi:hypothetical protein